MNLVGMRHLHICLAQVRFFLPLLIFLGGNATEIIDVYSLLTFWQQKRKLLVIKLFNFNIKVNKILIEIDAIIYLGLNDHIKSVAF